MAIERDPHCGPVPAAALEADRLARGERGRVEILNATRPGGMDGWTMDVRQYELLRELILAEAAAAEDGVLLKDLVAIAQERLGRHERFPGGRLRNYVTYVKVDLEARCEVERLPRSSPQRVVRWRPG
jgi:hypothetical protein